MQADPDNARSGRTSARLGIGAALIVGASAAVFLLHRSPPQGEVSLSDVRAALARRDYAAAESLA
jgi:hypothetical protein